MDMEGQQADLENSVSQPEQTQGGSTAQQPKMTIEEIESKYPLHTVFLHNVPYEMNQDELRKMAEKFGEISFFYQIIKKKGLCFITYYDLRDAMKAKKDFNSVRVFNRYIEATYAYKPEFEHRRDLSKVCSQLTVVSQTPLNPEEVKNVFAKCGEMRDFVVETNMKFIVKYWDTRSAKAALSDVNNVGGNSITVEYLPDQDVSALLPEHPPRNKRGGKPKSEFGQRDNFDQNSRNTRRDNYNQYQQRNYQQPAANYNYPPAPYGYGYPPQGYPQTYQYQPQASQYGYQQYQQYPSQPQQPMSGYPQYDYSQYQYPPMPAQPPQNQPPPAPAPPPSAYGAPQQEAPNYNTNSQFPTSNLGELARLLDQ